MRRAIDVQRESRQIRNRVSEETTGGWDMSFRLNSNRISRLILCAVAEISLCVAPHLNAQVTGVTILGTVTDASGAADQMDDISFAKSATGLVKFTNTCP